MYIFTLDNLINIIKVLYLPSYSAYVIFVPQEEVILSFILTMEGRKKSLIMITLMVNQLLF